MFLQDGKITPIGKEKVVINLQSPDCPKIEILRFLAFLPRVA
jgi:hypothetical protein